MKKLERQLTESYQFNIYCYICFVQNCIKNKKSKSTINNKYSKQMVTFVCQYCDVTLKKKQVQGHIRGRCSPGAMICIDCSHTFHGMEFKDHISCISEQQKHWGQYAKPKKTKQIAKQPKDDKKPSQNPNSKNWQQKQTQLTKSEKIKTEIVDKKQQTHIKTRSEDKMQEQKHEPQHNEDQGWKGWKKQIKSLIQQNGSVQKSVLLKKLKKIYKKKNGQDIGSEQIQAIFQEKIQKIKNVCEKTFYSVA